MDNNDILIRLRYALNIRDKDMQKILKLGGVDFTQEEVKKLLIKSKETDRNANDIVEKTNENDESLKCKNSTLEAFFNGLIIFKRGQQETKPDQPEIIENTNSDNLNNIMLKKLKIALSLKSEDMMDIFHKAGISITKGELSALLRKKGQKNYKECGDKFARNFLKGLTIKIRG